MTHLRQLKCVIIARVPQTHKYNDLRLSKLLATDEINRVPPEFEIIWNGSWWEMIHLRRYPWNSNAEIYLPAPVYSRCPSYPVEFVRASWALPPPAPGLRSASAQRGSSLGRSSYVVYLGGHPSHNIFPRNTDVLKGQADTDLTE